jgi:hypothetical protein
MLDDMALHSGLEAQQSTLHRSCSTVRRVRRIIGRRRRLQFPDCRYLGGIHGQLDATRTSLLRIAGPLVHGNMFTIDWHFAGGHAGLSSATFDGSPIRRRSTSPTRWASRFASFVDATSLREQCSSSRGRPVPAGVWCGPFWPPLPRAK